MEKQIQSQNMIFSRLNPPKYEHLKPLSLYSRRMITCGQDATPPQPGEFSNPFINFKIEVVNTGANKRNSDYLISDDGYETPAKLPCSPNSLSPDLGCFMDYCSPPPRHESVSSVANNNHAYVGKATRVRSKIKATQRFRQQSAHVGYGSSTDPRGEQEPVPRSLKNERLLVDIEPAFDQDVNNILCLKPFGTYTAGGLLDNVETCKNPSRKMFPSEPVLSPTVARGKEVETGAGQAEERRGKLNKEMCLSVKDEEEDKGYFSLSYINERKAGKTPPHSAGHQLPTPNSAPHVGKVEAELPEDECHSEGSEPLCQRRASMPGQCFSFTEDDLCATVRGRLMVPVNIPVESLEGDITEGWHIGPPVFESSICQSVTVALDPASEQSRQVSEKVQVVVTETIRECHATLGGEGTTLDTSWESTLPLQVQVKSEVVLASQHNRKPEAPVPAGCNTKARKPNEDTAVQTATCRTHKRPVVFDKEEDCELEKRRYVQSVTSHMNEKPGSAEGALSELNNLMTNVADKNSNDKQWQHPSDLTCRNYQKRLGKVTPKMTLGDWLAKNSKTQRRFDKVPKIFKRSCIL